MIALMDGMFNADIIISDPGAYSFTWQIHNIG